MIRKGKITEVNTTMEVGVPWSKSVKAFHLLRINRWQRYERLASKEPRVWWSGAGTITARSLPSFATAAKSCSSLATQQLELETLCHLSRCKFVYNSYNSCKWRLPIDVICAAESSCSFREVGLDAEVRIAVSCRLSCSGFAKPLLHVPSQVC